MKILIKKMTRFGIIATILSVLSFSCSSSDSASKNLIGKIFNGVAVANCGNPTSITNLTSSDYVLMSFEDASGNEISYQPKPNTWYKMGYGNTWVKTGTDVAPKDSPASFGFLSTEYKSPCQ
jgi:hypothetical protein